MPSFLLSSSPICFNSGCLATHHSSLNTLYVVWQAEAHTTIGDVRSVARIHIPGYWTASIVWIFSLHALFSENNANVPITERFIQELLDNSPITEMSEQQALVSAGRICRWAYTESECRSYYARLCSFDDYILVEELFSIEISKALFPERVGDRAGYVRHLEAAFDWSVKLGEWPWRAWIAMKLATYESGNEIVLLDDRKS